MKKKDAYYFSHDANSQDDPKCMALIDEMGMEGYGIFWALIEKLRSEKDYKLPIKLIPFLAKRWGVDYEKVEKVVNNYDLFKKSSEKFYSLRLIKSMEKKSEAGKAAAAKRWGDANAMRPHTERNANAMRNDAIKVKESKVKKKNMDFSPDGDFSNEQFLGLPPKGFVI